MTSGKAATMSDGPTEEEIRKARAHAQEAAETAKAMAPYVDANRLNPLLLKRTLDTFAPGNDASEDGIYDQRWLDAAAFYRFTEEYVLSVDKLAYKHALDQLFPKKVT
jgi:hypothetical protein